MVFHGARTCLALIPRDHISRQNSQLTPRKVYTALQTTGIYHNPTKVDFKPFFKQRFLFCLKTFPVKGETDSTGNSKVRLAKQPHPVSGPLADHCLLHLLTHYQHEVGVNKKYLVLSLL